MAGLRTNVDQDDHVGLEHAAERMEYPAVAIDLFRVALLEAKDHLDRHEVVVRRGRRLNELGRRIDGHLRRVFEQVRDRFLVIYLTLHDAVLVHTHGGEHIECFLVAWVNPVKDKRDDHALPARVTVVHVWVPFGPLAAHVAYVEHDTVHRSREQIAVLVVVCQGNQDVSRPLVLVPRPDTPAIFEHKVVWIARHSRVPHVRELFGRALLAIRRQHGIGHGCRHGVVDNPVAGRELYLTSASVLRWLLASLPPIFVDRWHIEMQLRVVLLQAALVERACSQGLHGRIFIIWLIICIPDILSTVVMDRLIAAHRLQEMLL